MQSIKRAMHDVYPYISAGGRLAGAADGRKILITGGGKGIGKAMSKHFAQAGASKIWITGRDEAALQQTATEIKQQHAACKVKPVVADLTTPDAVDKLFSQLDGEVPDILLNNAGASSAQHIMDTDPQDWWRDWQINVFGVYLVTRAWLRMLNGRPGIVITTSSSVSDLVAPNMSSYGASKHAVNRFMEVVQLENGDKGVRAHSFHPGGIASTGMGQNAPEQYRHRLNDTVDLAAGTALYLTTPEAAYLAGRFVYSNWDMEQVLKLKDEITKDDLLVSRLSYGSVLSADAVA